MQAIVGDNFGGGWDGEKQKLQKQMIGGAGARCAKKTTRQGGSAQATEGARKMSRYTDP